MSWWNPIARLRHFRKRWRATHDAVREHGEALKDLRAEVGDVRAAVEALPGRIAEALEPHGRRIADLEESGGVAELHGRILPTMLWIEGADVPTDALVSVIMPTRNRSGLVGEAVRSVLEQSYPTWELVVVDDDSEDDTAAVLASFGDERIRVIRGKGRGAAAARNHGLEAARGNIVAYLDDDNRMHPHWLRSLVWAFSQRPDADVLYGARVIQDSRAIASSRDGRFAAIHFRPFDRRRLEQGNFIDLGVLAHRAGLSEGRFDETLPTLSDWDLVLRLTEGKPPVVLPAIAGTYGTSAPNRLTDHPDKRRAEEAVRARVRARPPRMLAYSAMFPLISESYMQDELEALARHGVELALYRKHRPMVEMPVDLPLYSRIEAALREFDPDALFLYWLPWALEELERLESIGLPFAVRTHSFDYDPEAAARLVRHPNCIGVWAFPEHAAAIPGALALPTLFTSVEDLPPPAPVRDLVLSVSAGLPKKDWDLLLGAFCRLEGVERRIVLAHTKDFEWLPEDVAERAGRCADPPLVQADLPRQAVFGLLARAAALVYTLDPGQSFGMPMSVVEALCAGASVILPDRPEARRFAGPGARHYVSLDDIVRHAREALAGGPEVEAERERNRDHGMRTFCDPAIADRFHAELVGRLAAWRAAR